MKSPMYDGMPMNKQKDIIQIPPNLKAPGFFIKCRVCKTWVKNKCRLTGKEIVQCPHQDKLCFLSAVEKPKGEGERSILTINERNPHKAFQIHLQHRNEIKEGKQIENQRQLETNRNVFKKVKQVLLVYIMALYLDVKAGIGVPEHKIAIKSEKHQQEISRVFKNFVLCLGQNCVNSKTISIDQINDFHVGKFHKALEEREVSGRTYNKEMGIMKTFFNYLMREKYTTDNPFIGITKQEENAKREDTVSKENFKKLLQEFKNPESSKQTFSTGEVKNLHKDWLPDIAEYGLYTGRRLTELCMSRRQDIKFKDGQPDHIEFVDLKATHRKSPKAKPKMVYMPVIPQLYDFLLRKGLERQKDTNEFIIAPNENMTRKVIAHHTSRAVSHYFKKIGCNHTFHSLRRTYITELAKSVGPEMASFICGHSTPTVTKEKYLNPIELLKVINVSKMF